MTLKNALGAVASAVMLAWPFCAQAADITRYVFMTGDDRPAGEQVVDCDGALTTVRYIFKDNGRGPEHRRAGRSSWVRVS
jgi:hypothetical protein